MKTVELYPSTVHYRGKKIGKNGNPAMTHTGSGAAHSKYRVSTVRVLLLKRQAAQR